MLIGVPRETKPREYRVALLPRQAELLRDQGHRVVVQASAGQGAGWSDADYAAAGATLGTAADAWGCELVLKVKEPLPGEYGYLSGQLLFTFLHLAGAPPELTAKLLASKTTAIAYETVEDARRRLPLLAPMSAIAGNMATLVGAYYLAHHHGGRGVQLGRVLGQRHGRVLVIGDGVVGTHASATAEGMGAEVVFLGRDPQRAAAPSNANGYPQYLYSEPAVVAQQAASADLVVGAVLLRGARAPQVVTEAMVAAMQPGSVIVDVAIDQGGSVATSRATTHDDPVFERHGVIHYCVANMPGAYPRTATLALCGATFPYAERLANLGLDALRQDPGFARGLNTHGGRITCLPVAEALGLDAQFRPAAEALAG